jgi:hypothetical protein
MSTRGLELTLTALRAQFASIAWPRYELRLIDAQRRQCLATRYWTAAQLLDPGTVCFLRGHNREGCDVYFRPHAASQNAGYLLLDFDGGPCPLAAMRAASHTPSLGCRNQPWPSTGLGTRESWQRHTRVCDRGSSLVGRALWSRSSQRRVAAHGPSGGVHQSQARQAPT